MISLSGMLQAVIFCGVGPIADYGHYRKALFNISSITGGIGVCIYYLFWDPATWYLAGILTVILNVLYGLSTIAYNAYLPLLVESHENITNEVKNGIKQESLNISIEKLTNEISQIGFAIGYVGTIVSVLITVALLLIYPPLNYYIDQDFYGFTENVNNDNSVSNFISFDEQFAHKINAIEIYYSSDKLYSMRMRYEDPVYDQFTVKRGNYDIYMSNISQSIWNSSDGMSSVKLWTSADILSISSIQFSNTTTQSSIYGKNQSSSSTDSSSKISHKSWILGGWSGTIATSQQYPDRSYLTAISLLWIDPDSNSLWNTKGYRASILASGIWWLVFASFPMYYLKQRPGPPFPENEHWYLFGFKQVKQTIVEAKQNKDMWYYLMAWFLFSDGMGTFAAAAVIFATVELKLNNEQMGIMLLVGLVCAFLGNFLFLSIEKKFNISQKSMLLFHLFIMSLLPLWVGIGLIPNAPIGGVNAWEMYVIVTIYGLNVGSLQSYARSCFAMLIPEGKETEMFALFEITNKGSSWIGTLLIAVVSNLGSLRWGIFYVFLFFAIPMPLLYFKVDVRENNKVHILPRRASYAIKRDRSEIELCKGKEIEIG